MSPDGNRRQQQQLPRNRRRPTSAAIPVPQKHETGENEGQDDERENSVRPAAPEFRRPAERRREYVDVGKIRPDHHRGRSESGPAAKSCPRESRSDEGMADVVHAEMSKGGLARVSSLKHLFQ